MTLAKSPRPTWADFLGPGNAAAPDGIAWTLNGRNALFLALGTLGIRKGSGVLVPSFHCTAIIDPLLAYGAKPIYYPIRADLAPDLAEVERLAARAGAAALISIHYFGFPAPVQELARICARAGLLHIEDCCHALLGGIPAGDLGGFGDAALYSFRKTFPVQDGGALRLRRPPPPGVRPPILYEARMAKWTWDAMRGAGAAISAADAPAPATSPPLKARFTLAKGPDSHEDPAFAEPLAPWRASWISRWLIRRVDGARVRERRRANYLRLRDALAGQAGLTPSHPELPEGVCPMAFPLLTSLPFRLDYRLRKAGIPAFSFGETLSADMDLPRFPEAAALSRSLVLLPIHQGLADTDIDRLAAAARRAARGEGI
jgi:dTDP-4-amino-4,6-dideoxygalactose transaminase